MKAFFGKIWAWIVAHKLISGIIAGAAVVVLTVAIVVPVSVSASKKRKAAEQESHQTTPSGDQGGGGEQGGGGTPGHTHTFVFDSFVWKETPNSYTADAKYVCAADGVEELHEASVTKTDHTDPTCSATGSNHWHAEYDGHEDDKVEGIEALGHDWGDPDWNWSVDHQTATATFHCQRDGCTEAHEETATVENGGVSITHTTPAGHEDDGEDTYVATVTLDGENYESDPEMVPAPATGHEWNEFGFCSLDGAYNGDPTPLTFGVDRVIGEMEAGESKYFRVQATLRHRIVYAAVELESDEISFAYNNHGVATPVTITTSPAELENIGTDGYIYVKVTAKVDKSNASITMNEYHYSNYVGICHGCGDFLYPANELTVGTTMSGLSLTPGNPAFFRCEALSGHTYSLSRTNIDNNDIVLKYIGKNGTDDIQSLDLSQPFPEYSADNYIYIRINPSAPSTGAALTVNLVSHAFNGLGICSCGEYNGSDLSNGVATGMFDLAAGTKKFYHYVVSGTGDVVIHLEYAPGNAVAVGSMESEVYLKTSDPSQPYELTTYSDGANFDAYWQSNDGFFKAGDELYIVITNTSATSATNVTVTLTEE